MKLFNTKYYLILLSLLLLIDCSIGAFIGVWRESYWGALSNKEFYTWLYLLGQFALAALLSCFISGYSNYLGNILSLYYRGKLTSKALSLNYNLIEGGAQRVQEDCRDYPQLLIQLVTGGFKSFIMIFVFLTIIYMQLGLSYLIISMIYAGIGTVLASKIAKPLINLNYLNQVVEAKFRKRLQEFKKYLHQDNRRGIYLEVRTNNLNLFTKLKYLQYFQSFYNQITVIIPHIILLFVYFSGKITFGVFMQVASSIAELINNLSFFINSFDQINKLISCRKRLKELEII